MLATQPPNSTRRRFPLADQAKALAVVLREEFGVSFALYDAASGALVREREGEAAGEPAAAWERELVLRLVADNRNRVSRVPDGSYQLALLLYEAGKPALIAIGTLAALARSEAEAAQEQGRLQKWLQSFGDRLRLADQFLGRHRAEARDESQLAPAWEAILTLDQLLRRIRIHREPAKSQRRILQAARALLGCQALVWVPGQPGDSVLFDGEALLSSWDCRQLAHLLAQSPDAQKAGLLFCNQVQEASWGDRYPQLVTVMALQVSDQGPAGWLIALNKKDPAARAEAGQAPAVTPEPARALPFRRSDAALLTPFAALLDLHVRSAGRYADLKELLVGLTRSLTSAIDAKDSYTYGHSERVARIAVELGNELGLQEEEISDIYLAGLLHDIGKIGVRDDVLCKRGPLTAEEFEHVKQHVITGYKILSDLRPIRNLLPGVLYHHERYDGKGYPDGLAGENIPLLARILAVADGYDAMSTARPYRSALPFHKVEEILAQGAGTQWDRRVVDAFLRCRERIHAIRQRGVGESLCHALDGALRNEGSSRKQLLPSIQPTPVRKEEG